MNKYEVEIKTGEVKFINLEEVKHDVLKLKENMEQIHVTKENRMKTKALLARVREQVTNFKTFRTETKKQILQEFEVFNEQCNEILNLLNNSIDFIDSQQKQLETVEKEEKKDTIDKIYNKRITHYPVTQSLMHFEDFLQQNHLNKGTSMNKIELDMVGWLEEQEKILMQLITFKDAPRWINDYITHQNLEQTLSNIELSNQKEDYIATVIKRFQH